jgi:hypothetical protein
VKVEAVSMVQAAYGLTPPAALLAADGVNDGETPADDGTWTRDEVKRLLKEFQFIRGTFNKVFTGT